MLTAKGPPKASTAHGSENICSWIFPVSPKAELIWSTLFFQREPSLEGCEPLITTSPRAALCTPSLLEVLASSIQIYFGLIPKQENSSWWLKWTMRQPPPILSESRPPTTRTQAQSLWVSLFWCRVSPAPSRCGYSNKNPNRTHPPNVTGDVRGVQDSTPGHTEQCPENRPTPKCVGD